MNQIAIYQHPFVDVFQAFKVTEFKDSQKEGDVTSVYDKAIAKSVIKIGGTPQSNYIQVPAQKNLPQQSLGLIGKYVYLILQVPAGKQFVSHFDYVVNDSRSVRISISNLYKEFKNVDGKSLQLPLQNFPPNKWVVVSVNVLTLLEENKAFMAGKPSKFFLRSFQICASLQLKGVFTSDLQYTASTLPKAMQLKLSTASADWFSEHAWLTIPNVEIDHGNRPTTAKEKDNKKSILKITSPNDQHKKSVHFISSEEKKRQAAVKTTQLDEEGKTSDQRQKEELEQAREEAALERAEQTEQLVKIQKEGVERTLSEIEDLKRAYNLNLESKHISQHAQVTLYKTDDFYDPNKSQRRNGEKFALKPDPILVLDRILGVHPEHTSGEAFFNKDAKMASELIYSQANCIVGFHNTLQKQRLLLDAKVGEIKRLYVTRGYVITFSDQLTGKLERSGAEQTEIIMTVWDLDAQGVLIQVKPPLLKLKTISVCSDQSALALSGKDYQGRELILVYSFQDLVRHQKVELLGRQICDFDLGSLKFVDTFNQTLIGCGKANNATLVMKETKTSESIANYKARLMKEEVAPPTTAPEPKSSKSKSPGKGKRKSLVETKKEVEKPQREITKETLRKAYDKQSESHKVLVDDSGMIRFFKIKSNFLPSQLVSLDNTARGKVFTNSEVTLDKDAKSKIQMVYATTECGLLYMVNFYSRMVMKIIHLHNGPIQSLINGDTFMLSASQEGNLKIWSPDFSKLVSEVSINQQIASCDVNVTNSEICVMACDGTLSVFELENNSFKIVMRSHQDDVIQTCHSAFSGCLVSIGCDSSIKVWNAENLDQIQQIHEFNTSESDPPSFIVASEFDDAIAVGFKSGFIRLFNLIGDKQMQHEVMVYDSKVTGIAFSKCGKFMASVYLNGKLVIFNIERGDCKPINNKEIESPHQIYAGLDFSPDGAYLANIGTNSSMITIWETKNFSLRWQVDLPGEMISKILFAPNCHDLLVMTTTSKLKYMRYNPSMAEVESVRDQFGITDQECTDFAVSANNKFVIASGKDGQIKVYDYFMRGELLASQQAFIGHLKHAKSLCLQKDLRFLYSVGPGNGIYRWAFFGDHSMPDDVLTLFEKTKVELDLELEKQNKDINLPTFDQKELMQYSEQQLGQIRAELIGKKEKNQYAPSEIIKIPRAHTELIKDGGVSLKRMPKLECTPAGYAFERHEIQLQKLLGCSLAPKVGNNICWDRKNKCIIYSMQNVVIFEQTNQEKTQLLKKEVNDTIHEIVLSKNQQLVLAYTRTGPMDGYPQIIVWDTKTRRKISQLTIDDHEIKSVQFSNYDNMLLVVSFDGKENSTIAVWDFLDGAQEYLAKARVPYEVLMARWNPYKNNTSDEFMTICKDKYHYWLCTQDLQMKYQPGKQPPKIDGSLTYLSFVEPMYEQNSVYALIGLSTGYIWVLDTKTNSFLHSVKVLNCAILKLTSTVSRIVVEGKDDPKIHSWELKKTIADFDYDARDPDYFFAGKEQLLTLDGAPSASFYDETAVEAIVISKNNSIWLVNILESVTVKIKSCHAPTSDLRAVDFKYVSPSQYSPDQTNDQQYLFDQNYLIGSSGRDGIVKLWSMFDMDHIINFIVPKEECSAIAMHQFKPYSICSFTDGYLRFFDIQSGHNMGRCLVNSANEEQPDLVDYVTEIRILPSGNHVMTATKYGQILLIFVESWAPLAITIQNLVSLNQSLSSFDVSFLEPYNKWLASTNSGKVLVYNRQDCNSFKQELFDQRSPPNFIFMDSFNVQEYVDNSFTEAKRVNTLDHFYSMAKRNLVFNETSPDNETEACFLNNDLASYICYIRKCNALFIRNFELHQVVKKIDFTMRCLSLKMAPGSSPYVFLLLESNKIQMIDFVNEQNSVEIETIHDEVKCLKVCPNGRYVLTSGSSGDIAIWSVRRIRTN